jgi:eukaryotic-like serine/threonine-protein kinase
MVRERNARKDHLPVSERDLFIAALQIEDPAGRSACLDKACGDDAELRQRVEALLQAFTQAGSFLQQPAADPGATSDVPPAEPSQNSAPAEGPGAVVGPYKLLQQIGEGGMGTVFMAEQTQPVKRKVALKVIKSGMDSRQVIARFEAERQALAMMDHVNIARVLDAGATDSGRPYFVMELVHGVPITKYCDDNQLTPRERLELFVPVCQAIQHAHQKGIIHRDVKPSNVMVTLYDGKPVPKVIDFGVAKATEHKLTERTLFTQYGTMVGTLEYMSPEQAEMSALGVDTRSDIYSLGVLLYELLTGSTPLTRKRFKDAAYGEILRIIKEEEPPKPSTRLSDSGEALASISAQRKTEPAKLSKLMRGELDWIVMKSLEKDRNRRYETATGFAADVQRYLTDEPVLAGAPSAAYRFRKFARRNRVALSTAALVLAALVVGTCVSTWQAIRATHAEDLAETRLQAETAQRALAEQRFQLAKDAVGKYLQDVTEDEDLKRADFNKLRKRLLQSAVPFYQKFVEQKSGDPALEAARGTAYFRLALLRAEMGEQEAALADYKQVRAIFTKLAADFPTVPAYRQDLAGSHNNLGILLDDLGKRGEAEAEYRAALTTQEKLAADFPTVPRYRQELARSHNNLGNLLSAFGKRGEAESEYRAALTIQEKLAADFPTVPAYRQELARSHNNLGALLAQLGKRGEAEAEVRAARTIYEKLAADFPTVPAYRQELAASHHNLGKPLDDLGKRGEAEAEYRAALTIYEKLAADFPTVPEYRQDLAMSHFNLGVLLAEVGKRGGAESAYRAALTMQEKLAADFPTVPAYRLDLAMSHFNLGILLADLGKRGEAEAEYRAALTMQEKLAADFPTVAAYRQELAMSHFNLGILLADLGKRGEAEAEVRAALTIQEKLAADFPTVPVYRQGLAASHNNLGVLLDDLGKRGEAEAESRAALTIREKLAADFPTVPAYRQELASSHNNLGRLLADLGKRGEAEAEYRAALTIYEKLAADFPGVPDYEIELGCIYSNLGNLRSDQGRQQDALAEYAKAIRCLEVLAEDKRLVKAREFARNAFVGRARALTELKRYAEALQDWDRAIELDDSEEKTASRVERAVTLIRSGDHARAVAEANALAAEKAVTGDTLYDAACVLSIGSSVVKQDAKLQQQYAVRAVELLTLAKGQGYFKDAQNVEHMNKDSDIDPLRQREDYKKLLAELEAKK